MGQTQSAPEGKQGTQGIQGIRGLEGKPGPQGLEGKQGPQGLEGKQGPQGLEGKQGPQGLAGPQGLEGKPGPQGLEGKPGPQGIQGPKGESVKNWSDWIESDKQTFITAIYTNEIFKNDVKNKIATDIAFRNALGVVMRGDAAFRISVQNALISDTTFVSSVATSVADTGALKTSLITSLKADATFTNSIKGAKGDPGAAGAAGVSIAEVENKIKSNGLWCANGTCILPSGGSTIDFNKGHSKIFDNAQLTLETDDQINFSIGTTQKNLVGTLTNDNLHLYGTRGLQFGHGFTREGSAGQISYGRHDGGQDGSLNIIGAGKSGGSRRVRIWDSLQIGDWTIEQEGEHLVFKKGNAPNESDKGHFRMTGDGNLWLNRATGRGWVADNVGVLYGRTQHIANDGVANKNFTIIGRDGSGHRFQGNSFSELWDNAVRTDRRYALQNEDNRRLQMEGGTARAVDAHSWGNWEKLRFIPG